ncbi:uncharacterized protein LOC130704251 [Daphnia carinata]|uniref:uncharacterized protein LOC130704251 n=1 Tax=Daphnia carinata TaxID=120202 RepID=UPI00257A8F5F|nr:uncharacterized protein LOC130704251 [Daphnia carinata]XP_059352413.1 uncharacterized protein LOC130704251 [Daphnia carinata]XP_059352415.1 uncharacterized protein LOC130704251 [Daphnia carinata]XP_059352416.1 uncharacterized protein LOC130704251 [Daphnia carinata]
MSRDHSRPLIPCLLSLPFRIYCFHCHEVGHEAKQFPIGNSVKQPNKRKSDESQGCCGHAKKGTHAIDCHSLAIVTQEIGSSAEKPCISRWATGANAVAELVGGKTPVVRISVDNNPVAAGSSTIEETLQESFVTQKNIANATFSVESKSVITEADIDELLASARFAGNKKADTLSSIKSDSSVSKTKLIPNYANRNAGNSSPCLPSPISTEGSSGTKDDKKGNEKGETGKNKNADIQICNLFCQPFIFIFFNSKRVGTLRNQEKQRCEELAKKMQIEQRRSELFPEIFKKDEKRCVSRKDDASRITSTRNAKEKCGRRRGLGSYRID